ncbi:MAG TPA: hypothetical protein VJS12_09535 [Steroidobacteraceae bacterium]|nr:hypothetical protein [Steroidobacteraceae bacterium]
MKTLQVLGTAYRATLEEQDDPVLWMTQAMQGAGGKLGILLCGTAASYAVHGQSPDALRIGAWAQRHPPDVVAALRSLLANGAEVFVVKDDLDERAIPHDRLIDGVQPVPRSSLASIYDRYERVWQW